MKNKIIFVIKYLILSLAAFAIIVIPFWMLIVNSFKPASEARSLSLSLPVKWNIVENYSTVIIEGHLLRGFLNTTILTVCSCLVIVILGSLLSWFIARRKSKITSILYYICISGILIPPAVVATIRILKVLHIYATYPGLILFYSGAMMPFVIFFTTGFIKNIPIELEQAAQIDGASPIGVFFKIIFPLLRPVRLTSIVFVALFIWNDFLYPFYFTNKSNQFTMVLGLYNFIGRFYNQVRWELVFADVIVVSLPLIILYIFAQRNIVAGIMGGATKG